MTEKKQTETPLKILRSFLMGTLVLSLFTADEIEVWTHDLPASLISNCVIDLAKSWRDTTHMFFLDRPHAALRSWMRHAEAKSE